MSTDPKKTPPRPAAKPESLEDAVYKSSLSAGHDELKKGNPAITIPATILMYSAFGAMGYYMAKNTEAGQKALKAIGNVVLTEDAPPPPPPPAASSSKPHEEQPKDEPKVDPTKEIVPETPKELPKEDKSGSGAPGVDGGVVGGDPIHGVKGGVLGGVPGGVVGGVVGGTGKVVDFDFSNIRIKYQPPQPPYPPLAKMARVQGTVVVEITVGPDGVPTQAVAKEGPPQLRQHAERYAMNWRFEPALLNGQPQYARFQLKLVFRLQ